MKPKHRRHLSLPDAKAALDELKESYMSMQITFKLQQRQRDKHKASLRKELVQRMRSLAMTTDSVVSTSDEVWQSNRDIIAVALGKLGGPLRQLGLDAISRSKGERFVLLISQHSVLGVYVPQGGCLMKLVCLRGSPQVIKESEIRQKFRFSANQFRPITHAMQQEDAVAC
jgi:hypothetical protein